MKDPVTVRTTMRPDEEIEVTEAEALDLKRSGLLVGDDRPADAEPESVKLGPARRRVESRETNE